MPAGVMAGFLRIEYAGAIYHVMARGNQGRAIFGDARVLALAGGAAADGSLQQRQRWDPENEPWWSSPIPKSQATTTPFEKEGDDKMNGHQFPRTDPFNFLGLTLS